MHCGHDLDTCNVNYREALKLWTPPEFYLHDVLVAMAKGNMRMNIF